MITGAKKHSVMVKVGYGNETSFIPLDEIELNGEPLGEVLKKKDDVMAELNKQHNEVTRKLRNKLETQEATITALNERLAKVEQDTLKQITASQEVIKGLITR